MIQRHAFVRAAVLSTLSVPIVLVIACSGGSGSVGGGAPIPADQFGKMALEKLCGAIQNCCTQNGFAEDFKTCTQGAAALQASFDKDRSKHPDFVYDAQKAGNCVAKIASIYSSCNYKSDRTQENDPDCEGYFRGTKAIGSECGSTDECAVGAGRVSCLGNVSTSSTDGGVTKTNGICVPLKAPAEGDPCFTYATAGDRPNGSTVYGDCEFTSDDFYCDQATKKCKKRVAVGDTCVTQTDTGSYTSSLACPKDAQCDYTSKQCVSLPKAGESCEKTGQCASTAYCDQGTKKCLAKKNAGEDCSGNSQECVHACDGTTKKCIGNDVSRKICSGDVN